MTVQINGYRVEGSLSALLGLAQSQTSLGVATTYPHPERGCFNCKNSGFKCEGCFKIGDASYSKWEMIE